MKHLIIASFVGLFLTACSSQSKTKTSTTHNDDQIDKPQEVILTSESESSEIVGIKNFHYFSVKSLDETKELMMGDFRGKKILVVNVASKCGYTPQYEGLQKLQDTYGKQVQVIGFPCNQFMGQEPGTKEEIGAFCKQNYGVTFPMTTKVAVKGKNQHPIYKWLTTKTENQVGDYKVSWNFNKFLIDGNGKLVAHYSSKIKPMSDEIVSKIIK